MKQLIDKSALAAEIEKIISDETESIKSFEHNKNASEVQRSNARIGVLTYLRSFLTTLEVKEVDLEKEAELIANGIMIDVQANKYNTVVYNTKRNDFNHSHLMLAARKGIELGLKAVQRGEEI